jgi:hypothetical protein
LGEAQRKDKKMRSIYDIINASALGGMQVNYQNPADRGEYDYEGEMAKNQLLTIADAAEELYDMLEDDENLPEWVQSKITKAADYIDSVRDYMVAKDVDLDDEDMYGDDDDMYESTDLDLDEQIELEERYSKSIGYTGTEDMINRLTKILNPNSNLCKGISRDADNVVPEFKKMQKAMDQINSAWDEVERTVEQSMNEEVELDEAYHYYVTKNSIGADSKKLTHSKKNPFATEKDAFQHIIKSGGRQSGIIHKVDTETGKIVQNRGVDNGQKGYPAKASGDDPSHTRDLKEAVELGEAKVDIYHKHMLKALGKSRLPKDHQYTSAIATNGDFVVKDGGSRIVGRIPKGEHNLNEAKKVQGRKLTAKEIKAALASGKAQAKPKDQVSLAKTPWDDMKEDLSHITEKLSVAQGVGAWIDDFKKSDAPQFKGKSEKERRDMALAAYLSRKAEK